jgi:Cof subfamily protein (haloacid dehalogenase superfamily)
MHLPTSFSAFRLAAIDLDGTLLGPDKTISPENATAVRALQDAGLVVVLASGRQHSSILKYQQQLGFAGPIASCNGALVQDSADSSENAIWHEDFVPLDFAKEIISEGEKRDIAQSFYHPRGGIHISKRDKWIEIYEQRSGYTVLPPENLQAFAHLSPIKILWTSDPKTINTHLVERKAFYKDKLYVTRTDAEYLEFMSPTVNKAAGLEVICQKLGIGKSEVISFGDAENDIEMLTWAGCGVAMSHGHPKALAAANVIGAPGEEKTAFARAVMGL